MKPICILLLLLSVGLISGCDSCCDTDIPFLSTETLRSYIPYTEGEIIVFLKNGLDSIPMEVAADQLSSSGFGSPGYGGCHLYNTEFREVHLIGASPNLGFNIRLSGDRDSIIDIGNYTSANLLIDSAGHFPCRAPLSGNFSDLICLDSFLVSGKQCYHVIRHIEHLSKDTLYYAPEYGILKVCKQGGEHLERLW
ncbi:MAG: hypothetical protein ACKVU0_00955 [Saprospiraceae bacterium]